MCLIHTIWRSDRKFLLQYDHVKNKNKNCWCRIVRRVNKYDRQGNPLLLPKPKNVFVEGSEEDWEQVVEDYELEGYGPDVKGWSEIVPNRPPSDFPKGKKPKTDLMGRPKGKKNGGGGGGSGGKRHDGKGDDDGMGDLLGGMSNLRV